MYAVLNRHVVIGAAGRFWRLRHNTASVVPKLIITITSRVRIVASFPPRNAEVTIAQDAEVCGKLLLDGYDGRRSKNYFPIFQGSNFVPL
jgi:hypothetical protein